VHINLWQFEAPPGTDQEVVLDTFTFVPEDGPASTVRPVAAATEPNARLGLARPNPFNPTTTIAYSLALAGDAELVVYDVTGRRVRTLVDGFVTAGDHEVRWDGRDDGGEVVSSGVYFYRLRAGDVVETQRMVLLK
jgi:hypothetical protein